MAHVATKALVVLALALGGAGAAGCSDDDSPGPAGTPAPGDLRVALQSDGKTLDPHRATDAASMRLIENMYSTLMRYTPVYGELAGDLAERYEASADHLTYTFHLRPGVRFHGSGREVTAQDVRYSIERIRANEVRAEHFAAVERVEVRDARTLVLHLSRPSAPLLTHLAYPMNAVVDREVVEANGGSLDAADGGSGPFRLVEWRMDEHLILERSPYAPPAAFGEGGVGEPVRRIVYLPMPDQTARSTAVRNREVELVLDVAPKDLMVIRRAAGMNVGTVPGTFWEYVGMNTRRPPFDDVRVRQAVAWAVDREAINRVVNFGRSTVLDGGHIPPGHWAYADLHLYPRQNLARARQLLSEAGHADGLSVVLKVGSAFPTQVAAAQMVKQQLREIGVRIEIVAQESSVFFDALGRGDFDMTVCGWVGFVDPDEWTYNLFHTGAKWNQQGYASPAVDALLERGRATFDRDERRSIYRDAQRQIATDAPMVFLYVTDQTSAWPDGVENVVVHPTATTIFLPDVTLTRGQSGAPNPQSQSASQELGS